MDGMELIIAPLCLAVSVWYWGTWIKRLVCFVPLRGAYPFRVLLIAAQILGLILMTVVLGNYADPGVRGSYVYRVLFVVVWAVALAGSNELGRMLGWDALEALLQRNPATLAAITGLWWGTSLSVAGANIGSGPTIFTTLIPMGLTLAVLGLLVFSLAGTTDCQSAVGAGRDLACGFRVAGLTVAWGLILGRAVAGDWISLRATLGDLAVDGWPVLGLGLAGCIAERFFNPSDSRPRGHWMTGLIVGGVYVALSLAWVCWRGPWDGWS